MHCSCQIETNYARLLDISRERETLLYSVDRQYETYWTNAKTTHYSCIMPVFDTNDTSISPNHFAEKLVGATCEITFTLKHYAIRPHTKPDGRVVEPYDTFSAQVEAVVILKKPPVLVRSPYKGRLTRPPHHRPQLPTRNEHVNAAEAFVPKPATLGSTTVSQSATPFVSNPATSSETTTPGVSTVGVAPIASIEDAPIPCTPSTSTVTASVHPTTVHVISLPRNKTNHIKPQGDVFAIPN